MIMADSQLTTDVVTQQTFGDMFAFAGILSPVSEWTS